MYYDKNLYKVVTAFTSSTTFSATNLEMLGGTPLTTAEETAIINSFSPQMTAFNNVSNLYTTTERAIGIWIDGKTIYQKTIGTNVVVDDSPHNLVSLASIASNFDEVVDIQGLMKFTSSGIHGYVPMNTYYSNTYYSHLDTWDGYIRHKAGGWVGTLPAKITIKYTKL